MWGLGLLILILASSLVAPTTPAFDCTAVAVQDVCDEDCQFCQAKALIDYFWVLNGPNWLSNLDWPPDGDLSADNYILLDHCQWFGVYCCTENKTLTDITDSASLLYTLTNLTQCDVPFGVAVILLGQNNLNGSLSTEVLGASALRISLKLLVVDGNALEGSPQQSMEGAPFLQYVDMDGNHFSGTLPPGLFSNSSLTYLSLASNALTGSIPDFSETSPLAYIDISHNMLKGGIPDAWLDSPRLNFFSTGFNNLSGQIPGPHVDSSRLVAGWFMQWTTLEVRLQCNQLSGTIPATLAYLQLEVLDLAHNKLTGPIDSLLEGLPILNEFRVNNNNLTGTLPDRFGSKHLKLLSVKYNQLSGSLPEALGWQTDLTEALINNNKFSGDFPDSMQNLIGLELLTSMTSGLAYVGDTPNQNGDFLPDWLYFDKTPGLYNSIAADNYLLCKPLRVNRTLLPNLPSASVDPSYYRFQFCICAVGYNLATLHPGTANQTKGCVMELSSFDAHRTLIVATVTAVSGVVVAVAVAVSMAWMLRVQIAAFTLQRAKKRGPPEQGKMVTLVSTDVEGSTELWEWDRDAMDAATVVHDRVMRSRLSDFHGYEVTTEGDSFLIAFHEPADAVAWAVTMQQTLVMARWPSQLQHHERTCVRWMIDGSSELLASKLGVPSSPFASVTSAASSQHGPMSPQTSANLDGMPLGEPEGGPQRSLSLPRAPSMAVEIELSQRAERGSQEREQSQVAYRGLAVRMVIVTGRAEQVTFHGLSRRMDYGGQVVKLLKAINEVPHGGQVLIDANTFAAISSIIPDVAKLLGPRPDFDSLGKLTQEGPRARVRGTDSLSVLQTIDSGAHLSIEANSFPGRQLQTRPSWRSTSDLDVPAMQGQDLPPDTLEGLPEVAESAQGLLQSAWGAVGRYARGHGRPSCEEARAPRSPTPHRLMKLDSAKSNEGRSGGGSLDKPRRGHSWHDMLTGRRRGKGQAATGLGEDSLVLMDMGQHAIKEWPEPELLHQVLVPGLEDRARLTPELVTCEQLTSGYFDAPAAREARLGDRLLADQLFVPLPRITLVFCAIAELAEIKEHAAGPVAIALYLSCVRRLLKKTGGYECQEGDCTFMLGFERPLVAVQFCLLVQEELMNEVWGEDVLKIKQCRVQLGDRKQMLFAGPRVRMGLYQGVPARVCPHTVTGRADYFGPLVNRAARFCLSAAYGGQVVAPIELVQQVIAEWTQQPCPPMLKNGRPIITVRKDTLEVMAAAPPAVSPQPVSSGLSRIQSVFVLAQSTVPPSQEESQHLSSLRVMDWIERDIAATAVAPAAVAAEPPATAVALDQPLAAVADPLLPPIEDKWSSPFEPESHRSALVESWESVGSCNGATGTRRRYAGRSKTSAGLLAEMQAAAFLKLKGPSTDFGPDQFSKSHMSNPKLQLMLPPRSASVLYPTTSAGPLEEQPTKIRSAGMGPSPDAAALAALQPPRRLYERFSLDERSSSAKSHAHRRRSVVLLKPSYPDVHKGRLRTASMLSIGSGDSGFVSLLQSDGWKTIHEVEARHVGNMKFKGVAGVHTVMQINDARYGGRQFPAVPPSHKAELIAPGRGLAYSVILNR